MHGLAILFQISVFLFFLLATNYSYSIDQSVCENIPPSNGLPSQDLINSCSSPISEQRLVSFNSTGNMAIGWNSVSIDLESVELELPEVLASTELIGETRLNEFITGCEFGNSDTFNKLYCISDKGNLLVADFNEGTVVEVGEAGQFDNEGFSGLAMDPDTGIMYASSNNLKSSSIFTIDLNDATAVRIGSVTNSPGLIAIAINNQGQMFGYDIVYDVLVKINKNTGEATIVGPLGFDANFAQGMDFDESNNTCYLFAFNNVLFRPELRTCNTNTGLTTFIGVLGETDPGNTIQITGAGIAALAPEMSIFPIDPGLANFINTITAEGAAPNSDVAFIWGNRPGSVKVGGNVCNGLEIGIKNPKVIRIVKSSSDESASINVYVPFLSEVEIVVYTQAVDVKSCVKSDVIANSIKRQ